MRATLCLCAAVVLTSFSTAARAGGEGLSANAERVPWARFDARVVQAGTPSWRADLAPFERSGLKVGGFGLLGDMYLSSSPGGFRATSGVIVGARPYWSMPASSGGLAGSQKRLLGAAATSPAASAEAADHSTVPYLGVGYSNAWPKSGWRFSADVGVVSLSPGNASGIGRVIGGSQSLDDLVRDLRLAPVFQLGVSYSF
ncbi:MAG: hypothetical protein ABIO71_03200 [Caldimonas sp.]